MFNLPESTFLKKGKIRKTTKGKGRNFRTK
jgi:hypothetical protein